MCEIKMRNLISASNKKLSYRRDTACHCQLRTSFSACSLIAHFTALIRRRS